MKCREKDGIGSIGNRCLLRHFSGAPLQNPRQHIQREMTQILIAGVNDFLACRATRNYRPVLMRFECIPSRGASVLAVRLRASRYPSRPLFPFSRITFHHGVPARFTFQMYLFAVKLDIAFHASFQDQKLAIEYNGFGTLNLMEDGHAPILTRIARGQKWKSNLCQFLKSFCRKHQRTGPENRLQTDEKLKKVWEV